uniref:Uncharacterized protein n=1 Tax=Euplotes harpa TaxID=151035 RepID=A0A7S3JFX7_9SPIT|mmetsp:Transcript_34508/g.39930  ORF Transcript_34508/g.39930 Transcript_34508/m.39930 type:complete len:164 (+) Transcript_34508:91-582(+)
MVLPSKQPYIVCDPVVADNSSFKSRLPKTLHTSKATPKDKEKGKTKRKDSRQEKTQDKKEKAETAIPVEEVKEVVHVHEERVVKEVKEVIQTKAVTWIVAMTIPGSGKTKVKEEIVKEIEKTYDEKKIKLLHVSSDDIRAELTQQRMQTHKETREKAFNATQK